MTTKYPFSDSYPVINVTRDYAARTAKLNQERYLLNTQVARAHRGGCWWVPLSYTTQAVQDFNNTAPKAWMECGKNGESLPKTIQDLPGPDQWVIFNTQLSTLYKVNYDAQNWKLLIETLTNGDFERIHVINRAQLIDDALYLAWTGEQDYEIAMRLIEYLQREREYLPWKSAFENLKRVGRIVRQTPDFEFFKVGSGVLKYPNALLPRAPRIISFSFVFRKQYFQNCSHLTSSIHLTCHGQSTDSCSLS